MKTVSKSLPQIGPFKSHSINKCNMHFGAALSGAPLPCNPSQFKPIPAEILTDAHIELVKRSLNSNLPKLAEIYTTHKSEISNSSDLTQFYIEQTQNK